MNGVNGLLKYRYQKKESNLIDSGKSSPITVSSSTSSETLSGSPMSGNSKLFVASRTKYGGRMLLDSDDEDETISATSQSSTTGATSTPDIKSVSSAQSSPWLSKDKGIGTNGTAKINSSTSKLSTHSSLNADFQLKVKNIQSLFPDIEYTKVEQILRDAGGSEERATDDIIQTRQAATQADRKRKYSFFSSGSSSPIPVVKRARPLAVESDGSFDAGSQGGASTSNALLATTIEPSVLHERIKFLTEAFPGVDKEELEIILRKNRYDIDQASVALTAHVAASQPVSLTRNVGSIKAFQASRAQAKVYGVVAAPSQKLKEDDKEKTKNVRDGSDSDDEDVKYTGKGSKKGGAGLDEPVSTNEAVLNFFNTATCDELVAVDGCSKKKSELVVKLRPFLSWDDLVSKFENSNKTVSVSIIGECKELLRMRSCVRSLMEKCQKISIEMQTFIAELMAKTVIEERDRDRGYVVKQPRLIPETVTLKPYQMVGLNWLIMMHKHDLNGILGDEMGLGKTIQTIAFFAHLLEQGDPGPHLIVAPSSTLDNWLRELKLWCPSLKVLMYYGTQEERRDMRWAIMEGNMEEFNVIVTTYNMASGSSEDRQLFKKVKFNYAVFDEGHMLKNMASVRYRGLMKIMAERRLLLTGTPLQNNLIELMSLLAFAMPDMFAGKTDYFKKIFNSVSNRSGTDSRGNYEKETLEHAKRILKPFFLRRLKSDVMQQLPTKSDQVMKVALAFDQQELYDELKAQFVRDVNAERDPATTIRGMNGASMMMQLRKAANHHLLHRRVFDDGRLRQMAALMLEEPTHADANEQFVFEDMQVMSDFELHRLCQRYQGLDEFKLDQEQITDSGKFRHLDEVLPGFKSKGDRVLFFSQFTMMLDIVEDYMTSRDYKYIRLDGSTPVAERQELIDTFNTNGDIFIFLLSTKAGGMGINLTAANVVILHDIDFNPYNDKQAEDRCHRIGQTREVNIYRLVSKNTIEEGMLRCAQAKLRLERDVTTSNSDGSKEDPNDVASLLKEALEMENVE